MKKSVGLNLLGQALLLGATIAWGTSFVILKQTMESTPPMYIIALRFLIASFVLALVFIKKMITMDRKTLLRGMLLGAVVATAYLVQTVGLMFTTPARNAFLTSSYCVMCPFLVWLFFRKRPKSHNVISAVLCIVGIGFIALSGDNSNGSNMFLGDALTLLCAVFYGFQIILISRFQEKGSDSIRLLVMELFMVGIIHAIVSLIFELPKTGIEGYALNAEQIGKIIYLTVVCTLFAQFAQIFGQKFTTANQSSIILSLEAVFGVIFSVILGDEQLTAPLIVGFVIVFGAILISELKPDFLKPFRRKQVEEPALQSSEKNQAESNSEKIQE